MSASAAQPGAALPPAPRHGWLLRAVTEQLVQTYRRTNPAFAFDVARMPVRVLTHDVGALPAGAYDSAKGDLVVRVHDTFNSDSGSKYHVEELLGFGAFGHVYRCRRACAAAAQQSKAVAPAVCAVKVVKSRTAYFNQALAEINILYLLNKTQDARGFDVIVRLHEHFVWRRHLCLVFERLGVNLYEALRLAGHRGFELSVVRAITAQLLQALAVLGEAGVTHCDLKPENILFVDGQRPRVKLIDLGSAVRERAGARADRERCRVYVQSRYYRAPEVILGLRFGRAVDMWSAACISAELFLGTPLFAGESEEGQLARIVGACGTPPAHMLLGGARAGRYFRAVVVAEEGGEGAAEGAAESGGAAAADAAADAADVAQPAVAAAADGDGGAQCAAGAAAAAAAAAAVAAGAAAEAGASPPVAAVCFELLPALVARARATSEASQAPHDAPHALRAALAHADETNTAQRASRSRDRSRERPQLSSAAAAVAGPATAVDFAQEVAARMAAAYTPVDAPAAADAGAFPIARASVRAHLLLRALAAGRLPPLLPSTEPVSRPLAGAPAGPSDPTAPDGAAHAAAPPEPAPQPPADAACAGRPPRVEAPADSGAPPPPEASAGGGPSPCTAADPQPGRSTRSSRALHELGAFAAFVENLLILDPEQRWTPAEAAAHPFLTGAAGMGGEGSSAVEAECVRTALAAVRACSGELSDAAAAPAEAGAAPVAGGEGERLAGGPADSAAAEAVQTVAPPGPAPLPPQPLSPSEPPPVGRAEVDTPIGVAAGASSTASAARAMPVVAVARPAAHLPPSAMAQPQAAATPQAAHGHALGTRGPPAVSSTRWPPPGGAPPGAVSLPSAQPPPLAAASVTSSQLQAGGTARQGPGPVAVAVAAGSYDSTAAGMGC